MKIIKKYKYIMTIVIFVGLFISYLYLKNNLDNNRYQNIEIVNSDIGILNDNNMNEEQTIVLCSVDIKGAVINPGVYMVDCLSHVIDVINTAGGLTENADTSIINLAKKVSNEMVIIIYTHEEVKNSNIIETVIKTVEGECICPNITNDSCINDEITANIGEEIISEEGNNSNNENDNNLININKALQSELQTIPGIGEAKAKAIIKYRETNGNFKTIEDIIHVDGIGNKLYEEIKAYITT